MLLTKLFALSCLSSRRLLSNGASLSLESRSLRARHSHRYQPFDSDVPDADKAAQETSAAEQAIERVAVAEDLRTSHVLCRVVGAEGENSVTVRLQPSNNARSLVFNDDQEGVETTVRCRGQPDPHCVAAPKGTVGSVEECPECPCTENAGELFGEYANAMAREVNSRCHSNRGDTDTRFRVLMLGLGAGELASHLVNSCGGSELEAVELDGRLPSLAKRYFGLPASVKTTVGDAFPVVSAMEQAVAEDQLLADQRRFDTILVDCFSTGGVTPEHCRSPDFVRKLHGLLRDGGMVMHHMWHEDQRHPQVPTDFANTIAIYREIFACKGCEVHVEKLPTGPDSLIVATHPSAQN